MSVVRRYPRHSLAAGASVVILGAIWYSEIGGRQPVANQIAGNSSAVRTKDANNAAGTPAAGGTASPAKIASKGSGDGGVVKPDGNAPAPAGPTAPEQTPAPAPTVVANDVPASALPSLPAASAGDLAAAAKPEPAPSPASSFDQTTPSLLAGALPEPAPAPPPAGAADVKAKGDSVTPAPAMEAPALFGALASSPTPPAEGAPTPPPTGEPVQLATSLDEKNKPAPASNPLNQHSGGAPPQPAAPVTGAANAEPRPKDTPAVPEPKSIEKSADALKSATVAQSIQPLAQPEPNKNDAVKRVLPPHESAKVGEPAPVAINSADKPKDPPVVLPTPAPTLTEAKTTDTAQPAVDSPTSQLEPPAPDPAAQGGGSLPAPAALAPAAAAALLDSHVSMPESRSQAAESKPPARDTKAEPDNRAPQPRFRPRAPNRTARTLNRPSPTRAPELHGTWQATAGSRFRTVARSSSRMHPMPTLTAMTPARESVPRLPRPATSAPMPPRTSSFELESPDARRTPTRSKTGGARTVAYGAGGDPAHATAAGRVEPTAHVVEPNENFWTISRLYYSSAGIIVPCGRQMPTNIQKSIS